MSVIERLRELERRLADPMFALLVGIREGDIASAVRVADAADELFALRCRMSPEEYFNTAEACRARTKLDLAVSDLLDMDASHD